MKINTNIHQNIQLFAQELGVSASQDQLSERVRSEIIAAAIAIARNKEPENDVRLNTIYDIERTFIRCSKLLSSLWKARKQGEITETIFLNLEIQINDQLQRLLHASQQLKIIN